ncbi:MAG: hypothetical protein GC191_18735 [Azospirillum sp.]|nr:hypothetical protein [Azospirillum sp.]
MSPSESPAAKPAADTTSRAPDHGSDHDLEDYGGGSVQARHGYIPAWLLVVYAGLFAWALYYLVAFWGGLGPGRPV